MIDADADASSDQGDTDTSASNNSNQVAPASESANKFACAVVESGRGHSVAGFDNIALGMLTVFQCTTLAGWAQVMYRTMDSGTYLHFPNPGRLFGPINLTECSYMLRKTDTFVHRTQAPSSRSRTSCVWFFSGATSW